MAFWSGEKLDSLLPPLITPFDTNCIDCAAYTLSVGNDIFVTADQSPSVSVTQGVRITLKEKEQFIIPAGQFAYLHTQEIIRVPDNAVAFISMKATQKFKGLVNVSGFHVDPGWNGQLVFSVYNAGPAPVHLEQGMKLFLIWYCDLDRHSLKVKSMPNPKLGLHNELMANMSGQVFSPMALGSRFQVVAQDVESLRAEVRRFGSLFRWSAGIVMSFIIAFSIALFQLIGEPVRDFLLSEWRAHKSTTKSEQPNERSSANKDPGETNFLATKDQVVELPPAQNRPTTVAPTSDSKHKPVNKPRETESMQSNTPGKKAERKGSQEASPGP